MILIVLQYVLNLIGDFRGPFRDPRVPSQTRCFEGPLGLSGGQAPSGPLVIVHWFLQQNIWGTAFPRVPPSTTPLVLLRWRHWRCLTLVSATWTLTPLNRMIKHNETDYYYYSLFHRTVQTSSKNFLVCSVLTRRSSALETLLVPLRWLIDWLIDWVYVYNVDSGKTDVCKPYIWWWLRKPASCASCASFSFI